MSWWNRKKTDNNAPDKLFGMSYCVFDLETTGLNPENDHILSFAFLKIKDGQLQMHARFEGSVKLPEDTKMEAADIHQLVRADLENGMDEETFIREALDFLDDSIPVGHHVAFDLACLERLSKKHLNRTYSPSSVDTAKLGARLENPLMSAYAGTKTLKNLDRLCADYGIQPEARHSASGDTYSTALLFIKMLHKARERGIRQLI